MELGNLIIFDQDGAIIYQSGEMTGDVLPRKEVTKLDMIELDYGTLDWNTHRIVSIDPVTRQPILEEITVEVSAEQQRINELEDQLLLLADASAGGVL